jgi:hypothetical protein
MSTTPTLLALALALAVDVAAPTPPDLLTLAEKTSFVRTGRYDETADLCRAMQAAFPGRTRCDTMGTTPEGRPMVVLVVSSDGTLDPAKAKQRQRPVVLVQGGIHAGEVDGKDAGFMVLRDTLLANDPAGLLKKVTVVFVPVLNVDGHERFGPHQRPNQNGPVHTGWRTTSQNLNLNRDFAKVEAPETAAVLRLVNTWDPILYLDLHVTDGAHFQHGVAVLVDPVLGGAEVLRPAGAKLRDDVLSKLHARGHLPVGFYPSFVREDDPASGFALGTAPPRFATSYWPLRNRFAALVETHSWKGYGARVKATYDTVLSFLEAAARDGPSWQAMARAADQADLSRGGQTLPLLLRNTGVSRPIAFQGYAYRREPSPVSGALRIVYDLTRPETWTVPLFDDVKPVLEATVPAGGYVIPAGHASWAAEKLTLHGLSFTVLKEHREGVEVEAFRVTEKQFRPEPYEGRLTVQVKGNWATEKVGIAAGSLLVPTSQRGCQLLVQLLDPAGPDSFLAWGYFNAAMEQKEYMEAYVAEEVGERMLREDPAARELFVDRLDHDPTFAKDPEARLRFFYQRHPSWDRHLDRYPVFRLPGPLP